jgi:hypothetical protein
VVGQACHVRFAIFQLFPQPPVVLVQFGVGQRECLDLVGVDLHGLLQRPQRVVALPGYPLVFALDLGGLLAQRGQLGAL